MDGPFKHAIKVNLKYLLNKPDRLLAKFRIEAGLECGYKFVSEQEWAGEHDIFKNCVFKNLR